MTLATGLTLARIALTLPVVLAILFGFGLLAAILLGMAALTDFADGWVARTRNQVTPIGAVLDPIADKILNLSVMVGLVAAGTLSGPHLIPVFAIVFRELFISGLREGGAQIKLPVTALAKVKTTVQFIALVALCFGPSVIALGLFWLAAVLTLWTGADYMRRWLNIE
ncbi:CDP-alcohol phosphatidyltransferase family protein [Parvularcula sp. LCG005]|uniref:CDP-alcohol phosphatidyltransferase family protein n=1 Tax=Parvularcula sp. LCG005 TaxID=3078805 RepID=UPI002942FC88|nr:CDP-alcohol phosphatidyltransferase family protein [Parvularcula sp. LCG005]WOI52116.1 CDP-alcohol phosphatidyltransferase family protein [Parvularcula sp. LCG005]